MDGSVSQRSFTVEPDLHHPSGRFHQTVTIVWQRASADHCDTAWLFGLSLMESMMRVVIFLAALLCSLSSLATEVCKVGSDVERVSLREVSLAYQSIGRDSDPVLLLVMGLGGQLIHWPDDVVEHLCEQGFRVIRYDNRDVGLSRWNAEVPTVNLAYEVLRYRLGLSVGAPYELRDMAGDALGLMDALGIRQFHLLGASMGGMIAQHVADMAPQRVRSLTLVMTSSGAQGLPAPSPALLRLLSRRDAPSREVALEQQADLLAALGSPTVVDDRAMLLHQAEVAYDRAFNPVGVERQLLAILAETSRVDLLNRLQVPTLVVHGTADPLLPVMHGVHVAAHVRGSELRLIPGLAHRLQERFKAPLLAAVLPHLQAHRLDAQLVQM